MISKRLESSETGVNPHVVGRRLLNERSANVSPVFQDSNATIEEFLEEYDALPADLSETERHQRVCALMAQVRQKDDPYVSHVLKRLGVH